MKQLSWTVNSPKTFFCEGKKIKLTLHLNKVILNIKGKKHV